MPLTLKPKHPFTSVVMMPDVALPLLREMELLRIEALKSRCYDPGTASVHVIALTLLAVNHVDNADLFFYLNEFRDQTAAGYWRGSCLDWYYRSVQAIVANAAGFPDRQSWSSILYNTMGVPAPSL